MTPSRRTVAELAEEEEHEAGEGGKGAGEVLKTRHKEVVQRIKTTTKCATSGGGGDPTQVPTFQFALLHFTQALEEWGKREKLFRRKRSRQSNGLA